MATHATQEQKALHPIQTISNKVLEALTGAFDILFEDKPHITNKIVINLIYNDHMVIVFDGNHHVGIGMQFNQLEYQLVNNAPDIIVKEVIDTVWERLHQMGLTVMSVNIDSFFEITFMVREM